MDCAELLSKHHMHSSKAKCPQCRTPFLPKSGVVVTLGPVPIPSGDSSRNDTTLATSSSSSGGGSGGDWSAGNGSCSSSDPLQPVHIPGLLSHVAAPQHYARVKGKYSTKVTAIVAAVLELRRYVTCFRRFVAMYRV